MWIRSLGQEHPLEEEMATHSSILAWRVTWTEEPGGLQSIGLHRVGHDSQHHRGLFSIWGCYTNYAAMKFVCMSVAGHVYAFI